MTSPSQEEHKDMHHIPGPNCDADHGTGLCTAHQPVPNEPSDSPKPSAIGDGLRDIMFGSDPNMIAQVRKWSEQQTKLARLDELNAIQAAHDVNQYDCSVLKKVVADRMADLEASIKERSE